MGAYKLISLDKIPSTQDVAHDLIAAGRAKDKTVITATVQTAGRGRYRRTWVSRAGNLYASFLYKIRKPNPELSYAVAVAVAETLIHFGVPTQIKWPNDVLVDGKKISGILIEYSNNFVIIGIGINVAHAPRLPGYPTAKINDFTNVNLADLFAVRCISRAARRCPVLYRFSGHQKTGRTGRTGRTGSMAWTRPGNAHTNNINN